MQYKRLLPNTIHILFRDVGVLNLLVVDPLLYKSSKQAKKFWN